MDMFTHLQRWIAVLECELRPELVSDDYLFLYIGPNGLINPKQAMSHEVVQSLLSKFGMGAGDHMRFELRGCTCRRQAEVACIALSDGN